MEQRVDTSSAEYVIDTGQEPRAQSGVQGRRVHAKGHKIAGRSNEANLLINFRGAVANELT